MEWSQFKIAIRYNVVKGDWKSNPVFFTPKTKNKKLDQHGTQ